MLIVCGQPCLFVVRKSISWASLSRSNIMAEQRQASITKTEKKNQILCVAVSRIESLTNGPKMAQRKTRALTIQSTFIFLHHIDSNIFIMCQYWLNYVHNWVHWDKVIFISCRYLCWDFPRWDLILGIPTNQFWDIVRQDLISHIPSGIFKDEILSWKIPA